MMNYFLNTSLSLGLTGIERAQYERVKLFRKHGEKSAIVTFKDDPLLHFISEEKGILDEETINLFDYFCDNLEVSSKKNGLPEFNKDKNYQIQDIGKQGVEFGFNLLKDNKLKCQLRVLDFNNQIKNILYADTKGEKITKVETYDVRGFLRATGFLDKQQLKVRSEYYQSNGTKRMCFYYNKNKNDQVNRIEIYDKKGLKIKNIPNLESLNTYFLEELLSGEPQIKIIIDRTSDSKIFKKIGSRNKLYMFIHSTHLDENNKNKEEKHLNTFYAQALLNSDKFAGFFVSTHQQKADIQKIFPDCRNIFVIPAGYVSTSEKSIPYEGRQKQKIIFVGRISAEKRPVEAVEIFKQIHEELPNATLHFYGRAIGEEQTKLLRKIQTKIFEEGLQNSVKVEGYFDNMESIYNTSQLMLMTSRSEGFNISLLEALSCGVPVISYQIKYGPEDLITSSENGYLVTDNDAKEMAQRAITVLNNQIEGRRLSLNAIRMASKMFSEEKIWSNWQEWLCD